MKKQTFIARLFPLALIITTSLFVHAQEEVQTSVPEDQSLLAEKLTTTDKQHKRKKKKDKSKTIRFQYDNEDLLDIIYAIAAQKGVNVIMPQGANAITSATKVTLNIEEKVSLDEAWKLLLTIMDMAGYTLMPKGSLYIITKNSATIAREPLPLFIGTKPSNLPNTDQRIRYLYYLANVKVTDDEQGEINQILKNILPPTTSSFKMDAATNCIIITAKANEIKAAMEIVLELDKPDFQESLAVVQLRHTTAKLVADLFNESILKSAADMNRYRLDAKQQSEAVFFSKFTRVIPEERTNCLIILGRAQAIERIKEFIANHIDVELESGKSILHLYQLQYLDASTTEQVLNEIIKSSREGGTGQATAGQAVGGGIQETFDEVYIKADTPQGEARQQGYAGGNRLVIACRNKDWKVIERLLQDLDKPQPQVLIEVLIADLTLDDIRQLGSVLRNPAAIPMPGTSAYQDAQIGQGIILSQNTADITPETTLKSDLLRKAFNPDGTMGSQVSDAAFLPAGSTVFSLNDKDGKTWSLLSILKTFQNTKIISHPHVIATNNQNSQVTIGEDRYLFDEATSSGGTTTTIKKKTVKAHLTVNITPRISHANTVLLDVTVDIEDFTSNTNNTRVNRKVTTKALVADKNILALGGLIRLNDNEGLSETPILSKIPILGYFFKNRTGRTSKTNLSIFITPTIIEPRLRPGVDKYTRDYIAVAQQYSNEGGLFDSLRDPVTRWFFNSGPDTNDITETFMAKDEFKTDAREKELQKPVSEEENKPMKKKKRSALSVLPKAPEDRQEQLKQLIAADNFPLAAPVDKQVIV